MAEFDAIRESANTVLIAKRQESTIFDDEAESQVPTFHPHEIEHGIFLGQGGFCTVTEVLDIVLLKNKKEDTLPSNGFIRIQNRSYIAKNHQREDQARYAIKMLSKDLFSQGEDRFLAGIVDLAIEVKYLAIIQHPHIIKMRAIADVNPCSEQFFIMLDRLYDTLAQRMVGWKKENRRMSGLRSVKDLKGKKKEEELAKRMVVAYDICSALSFMHKNNIIYRDLKPDNAGFDVRDDIKIFDFGLAAEMRPSARVNGGDTYKLTAESGSPRYMAPECALGQPYNHMVDVYSFALLCWELLELKTPYAELDFDSLSANVFNGTERPPLNPKKSSILNQMIKDSWSRNPTERIECEDMMRILKGEIGLTFGNDSVLDKLDMTNKTAKSAEANGR